MTTDATSRSGSAIEGLSALGQGDGSEAIGFNAQANLWLTKVPCIAMLAKY
jgi:hypothetical protein